MRWLDPPGRPTLPRTTQIKLLRLAAAQRPQDSTVHQRLGAVLTDFGDSAAAVESLETARQLAPAAFDRHDCLAEGYLRLGRLTEALDAADRGLVAAPDNGELHYRRGTILMAMGRDAEGDEAVFAALRHNPDLPWAAERLLVRRAYGRDPARLLAVCDALPADYGHSTVVRGWRALGLSRVGRTEEAMELIDLERDMVAARFEPPAEFGGLEAFNRILADEIACNPDLSRDADLGFLATESLDGVNVRAFPALAAFIRAQVETFVRNWQWRGAVPRPDSGYFWTAGHVMTGDDHHTPHLHKLAIVSGVYYVAVPDALGDSRGVLRMGAVDERHDGINPCWGVREIAPVPGTLILFGSQVFHAVPPTLTDQPRIVVTFDLRFPPGTFAARTGSSDIGSALHSAVDFIRPSD